MHISLILQQAILFSLFLQMAAIHGILIQYLLQQVPMKQIGNRWFTAGIIITVVYALLWTVAPAQAYGRPLLQQHRYVFPVQPPDAASFGPYHHDYPATDIAAPEGSLFVAPTDGVVEALRRDDLWDGQVDDPATRGGDSPDGRKVKGTLHWVSAPHAARGEVRLYEYLFNKENPLDVENGKNWKDNLNPNSLTVLKDCCFEPGLATVEPGYRCQFERIGYFCADPDSTSDRPVFNRTVPLKDSWKKKRNS